MIGTGELKSTLALLDELRARGIRRVELHPDGTVAAVDFGEVSTGEPPKAEPETPDPAFAAHEAAILQVQRGAFSRRPES